jgi:tripartite-type tricarboxylate transporter receptor subunit TctC
MVGLLATSSGVRSAVNSLRDRVKRRTRGGLLGAAMVASTVLSLCATARAADYPDRTVRIVVPFAAGAGADIASRFMASKLGELWGVGTVVENKVGANGIIGANFVAHAPADGYTLLAPNDTTLAANPALYVELPYDPVKDFAPIALIGETPFILVASPTLHVHSVKELVDAARAKPGAISFGTGGVASSQHLPIEMLMAGARVKMLHVPFKGSQDAVNALAGDHVQVMFAGVSAVLPFLQNGTLVPLAVGAAERLSVLPNVPTMAESGYPGFHYGAWLGFVAPAGTSKAIVSKINADINSILRRPEVREQLLGMGFLPAPPGTSEEYRKFIADEVARYGKLIKAAGIEPQH